MTIGVAASGERAAWAVRDAVLGAELLGRGAWRSRRWFPYPA